MIPPLYFLKSWRKPKIEQPNGGGKLYFIYLPQFLRYGTVNQNHESFRNRSGVIKAIKNLNIPVIDIHKEVFENHPDPLSLFPLRGYGHYNAKGYKKVAHAIVDRVEKDSKN